MAGICCFLPPNYQSINRRSILRSIYGFKYFSGTPDKTRTPQFLKFAVSGVTELLRLFSSADQDRVPTQTNFVLATWKLRTYLKLPWRPLISIDGSTVYKLNDEFKVLVTVNSTDYAVC